MSSRRQFQVPLLPVDIERNRDLAGAGRRRPRHGAWWRHVALLNDNDSIIILGSDLFFLP
jgi:hypothetical protein